MDFDVVCNQQLEIVEVFARGDLTSEGAIEIAQYATKAAMENDFSAILCDYTQSKIAESIIGIYHNPSLAEKAGISRSIAVAALYAGDAEKVKFWETMYVNWGYNLRAFLNRQEAIEWLNGSQQTLFLKTLTA